MEGEPSEGGSGLYDIADERQVTGTLTGMCRLTGSRARLPLPFPDNTVEDGRADVLARRVDVRVDIVDD